MGSTLFLSFSSDWLDVSSVSLPIRGTRSTIASRVDRLGDTVAGHGRFLVQDLDRLTQRGDVGTLAVLDGDGDSGGLDEPGKALLRSGHALL